MKRDTLNVYIVLFIVIVAYYLYLNRENLQLEGFQLEGFSIVDSLFHFVFIIFVVILFAWLFGVLFDFVATLFVADKLKKHYGNYPNSPV